MSLEEEVLTGEKRPLIHTAPEVFPSPKRLKHDHDGDTDSHGSSSSSRLERRTPDVVSTGSSYSPYKLVRRVLCHDKAVSAVQFSPSGKYIATASADTTLKIWTKDGDLEQVLMGHAKGLSDVAWSTSEEYLASASDDRTVRIWNASSGRTVRVLKGHTNFVLCCVFHPAGNIVASGSFDESIKVWDLRTGACLKTLPAHSDPVSSIRFNIDGSMIVSCSHDGLIRIWDTVSGQCLKTLVDQDSPPVSFASFSPNGRVLLSCTLDSTIRLWNLVSSVPLKTYKGHLNQKYSINAEMSNAEIMTCGEDGNVYIWHTQEKNLLQTIVCSEQVLLSISRSMVAGRRSLAVVGLDQQLYIYSDS